MGVKPNATGEGVSSRLFTGVAPLKVVAINPNQAKLKELGYKAEKEPSYYSETAGHRIAFMLEGKAGNEVIKTNIAFFIKNKVQEDLFINTKGKFGKDRTKILGDVRNPFVGEVNLIQFISDWCNIKKDEDVFLDSMASIAMSGDVTELLQILEASPENTVKFLLTVRDKKYQSVYDRKFMRSWSTDLSYLHKSLVDNKDYLKDIEFGPIDFKLFVSSQFDLRLYGEEATAPSTASSNGKAAASDTAKTSQKESEPENEDKTPF